MNHMLITIANNGFADAIMEVAKNAGARGGTILHARGSAKQDAIQFLGITIQPEKDVILIIVNDEEKNTIMQAISTALGFGTKAHALTISLPVDGMVGISMDGQEKIEIQKDVETTK